MVDVTFRVSLAGLGCRHLSAKFRRGLSIQDTINQIDDHSVSVFDVFNSELLVANFLGQGGQASSECEKWSSMENYL